MRPSAPASSRAVGVVCAVVCALLAACGGEPAAPPVPIDDIDLPAPGTFEVRLSGALEVEFSGEAEAVLAPIGRAIYLTGERYSANLVLPADQTAGTYAVLPLLSAFNTAQNVTSIGGVLVDSEPPPDGGSDTEFPATWFDQIVSGRVTLRSVEPMTGAFEYTVLDADGQPIAVSAVFNALPQRVESP